MHKWMSIDNRVLEPKFEIHVGDSLGFTTIKFCSYLMEGDLETAKKIWFKGIQKSKLGPGQWIRHSDHSLIDLKGNPISRDHVLMGPIFGAVCIKKFTDDKALLLSSADNLDNLWKYGSSHDWLLSPNGRKDRIKFMSLRGFLFRIMKWRNTEEYRNMPFYRKWYETWRSKADKAVDLINACATKLFVSLDENSNNFEKRKKILEKISKIIGKRVYNVRGWYEYHLLYIKLLSYKWIGQEVSKPMKCLGDGIPVNPLYNLIPLIEQNKSLKVVEDELLLYPNNLPGAGRYPSHEETYRWQVNPIYWNIVRYPNLVEINSGIDYEFLFQLYRYYTNQQ